MSTSPQYPAADEVPGIVRTLRVLRERWWVVVLAALVCTGAALAVSLRAPKSYTATSKVLFRDPGLTAAVSGGSGGFNSFGDPSSAQATNVLLVTTTEVAAAVRRALHDRYSDGDLLARVGASTESNANIVDISVTGTNAIEDAQIANLWAQQFTLIRQQADRDKVAQGVALLKHQIAALPSGDTVDRTDLQGALAKLTPIEAVQTGNAEIVDLASQPTSPTSPKPKRDAIIALILGVVLGIGLAFVLELFDRRMKGVEDFESAYGRRVLTTVPLRGKEPSNDKERAAALEPFRILRNGLNFFSFQSDLRVVMVTSAVPGEGKTTVAAGLARAIALSGHAVVLIEADLRRPTLHHHFDVGPDRRGLTTALIGRVDPQELLREVVPGLSSLTVLPSGPLPPNSAELLGSMEMEMVIHRLRGRAEFIVLDAPPLLPVADAQVLLDHPQIDACLIVGRARVTTKEQARRAAAVIERHRLGNVGLVVNGLRDSSSGYDYYGPSDVVAPATSVPTPLRGEGELGQPRAREEVRSARPSDRPDEGDS